jgi:hypothetical protein
MAEEGQQLKDKSCDVKVFAAQNCGCSCEAKLAEKARVVLWCCCRTETPGTVL